MKLTRTSQPSWALFGLLPFVNVLFLVVIFFALSSRYVIQPGVAVIAPFSPFRMAPQRNPQLVSITAAPVPAIYFQDQRVTQEGFAEALRAHPARERTLIVKADRGAPHETVVAVMNEGLKLGYSVVLAGSDSAR